MLDSKDKKILRQLFLDGRTSIKQLAKSAGISPELAVYRVKRLYDSKILKRIIPILNHNKVGYDLYRVYININSIGERKRTIITEFFKELPNISRISELEGNWDYLLLFSCKSSSDFNQIYESIIKKVGQYIQDKNFSIIQKIKYISPQYLINQDKIVLNYESKQSYVKITQTQIKVIQALFVDGRSSVLSIAKKINMSATAVANCLRTMVKNKIILGFRPVIDVTKFDFDHLNFMLELENPADKLKVEQILMNNDNVVSITQSLGKYDLEFEVEYNTVKEAMNLIKEIKKIINIRSFEMIYNDSDKVVNDFPDFSLN